MKKVKTTKVRKNVDVDRLYDGRTV